MDFNLSCVELSTNLHKVVYSFSPVYQSFSRQMNKLIFMTLRCVLYILDPACLCKACTQESKMQRCPDIQKSACDNRIKIIKINSGRCILVCKEVAGRLTLR